MSDYSKTPRDPDKAYQAEILRGLLRSRAWVEVAELLPGRNPGETVLDSAKRELARLAR